MFTNDFYARLGRAVANDVSALLVARKNSAYLAFIEDLYGSLWLSRVDYFEEVCVLQEAIDRCCFCPDI